MLTRNAAAAGSDDTRPYNPYRFYVAHRVVETCRATMGSARVSVENPAQNKLRSHVVVASQNEPQRPEPQRSLSLWF
jgi:hypothetical protein